ncbi:uncharacterized protein LOC128236461 isoform X2 [Mya arenaria]|uniref:uncharacterized protein LOC128236461 isoform X2 n=1 Tax=Mya arenaria TaxID=6604 RepID=UPI0022E0201A|nr:uncharacterized protein LOC128236461 isoform X2 [Mya arenaria]
MFSGVVTGDIQSLLETTNRLSKVSTRQQSEDSIHKQLAAFERLLQHAMSRFSNENLFTFLRHVTRWAETNQNEEAKNKTSKTAFKLRSVNQLEEIVTKMKDDIKGATASGETANIFKTFELFFNDLLYLKDLKKYFDDEIFKALMKYHFDSSKADSRSVSPASMKRFDKLEDDDSGNGSQNETDRSSRGLNKHRPVRKKLPNATKVSNTTDDSETKYKRIVEEMKTILYKWEGLLSESDLDLNNFDPDSYHELMQFSNYTQFEPILRLVPDMFAKCYKCVDLAKTWLKLSNIVLKDLPFVEPESVEAELVEGFSDNDLKLLGIEDTEETPQTEAEFWEEVKKIQVQIQTVGKTISDDEDFLNKYHKEMDVLSGRDERFSNVSSQVEKIDSLITLAAGEYQKAKTEQYAVSSKMKTCEKGTPTYSELKSHLKRLDSTVAESHWKVKRLEYERTMLHDDFMVELEVRPSFIHFMGDTKEKISDLQRFLSVKREEKLKLEKQLALMKTNTERMRKIMRSYIGSATSTRSESRDLKSPEEQCVPKLNLHDGNEADDDSSSVAESDLQSVKMPTTKQRSCKSSIVTQKPKLVKRDIRPLSEKTSQQVQKEKVGAGSRVVREGPRAALKTTPRRVWENV